MRLEETSGTDVRVALYITNITSTADNKKRNRRELKRNKGD